MQQAAAIFSQQTFFKTAEHIACYLATPEEFDAALLIEMIWQAKKKCYLPVMQEDKTLGFVPYHYGDALRRNALQILEPAKPKRDIAPDALNVVITPLVAFDRNGDRLGTGGGYYDRTFAFLQERAANQVKLIGLGFALQEAKDIPVDPWDIKVQGVLTEKEYIECT
jgi:5-formyltetrahydrofolate cyclo-ligase